MAFWMWLAVDRRRFLVAIAVLAAVAGEVWLWDLRWPDERLFCANPYQAMAGLRALEPDPAACERQRRWSISVW